MIPSEEKGGTTPTTTAEAIDRLRLKYGFWIIITGFALVAFITIVATFRWSRLPAWPRWSVRWRAWSAP